MTVNPACPDNLIFISAQPDEIYFHWQVELYLYNFVKMGIAKNQCYAVFSIKDKPSDFIVNLKKEYPGIHWYQDDRDKNVQYISSIRPHVLKKFFFDFPEKGKNVFYHDSDILFHHLPPFQDMLKDNICYLSDTIDYIGYQYFQKIDATYKAAYPNLKSLDLFRIICI